MLVKQVLCVDTSQFISNPQFIRKYLPTCEEKKNNTQAPFLYIVKVWNLEIRTMMYTLAILPTLLKKVLNCMQAYFHKEFTSPDCICMSLSSTHTLGSYQLYMYTYMIKTCSPERPNSLPLLSSHHYLNVNM